MGSVKIVKKIVLGVFSEVRNYLSRSFIVVTGAFPSRQARSSSDFRVEPSVAGWLPHSPVRAQLRHTVLQARISLRRQSGPPLRVEAGKTA